jgi:hypothetical protein
MNLRFDIVNLVSQELDIRYEISLEMVEMAAGASLWGDGDLVEGDHAYRLSRNSRKRAVAMPSLVYGSIRAGRWYSVNDERV